MFETLKTANAKNAERTSITYVELDLEYGGVISGEHQGAQLMIDKRVVREAEQPVGAFFAAPEGGRCPPTPPTPARVCNARRRVAAEEIKTSVPSCVIL